MGKTTIEWADKSLNYYNWSCHKVSEGCKNCYMMAMAQRFGKDPVGIPEWRETAMKEYQNLVSGDVVFVNSMSDTYHEGLPVLWVQRIHRLASERPDVTFLMLTKRPQVALAIADMLIWSDNIWIGTSIELPKYVSRLDTLLQLPTKNFFISAEPLLASVADSLKPYMDSLKWVILGAESGANRRPFDVQWAREMRDLCQVHKVPYLYKQGSHFKSGMYRDLDGRTWDETPFKVNEPAPVIAPSKEPIQLRMF